MHALNVSMCSARGETKKSQKLFGLSFATSCMLGIHLALLYVIISLLTDYAMIWEESSPLKGV